MTGADLLASLEALAGNFRWVWHDGTQQVFRSVDSALWDSSGDPFRVIRSVTPERLRLLAEDHLFQRQLRSAEDDLTSYLAGAPVRPKVAYFCMEHGVAPPLRTYAGGLGMLAGCIEKTASDLGVPMVAVGLRYGWYFRQRLSYGWQSEEWVRADPDDAGLKLCPDGRTGVDLAGEWAVVQVWQARVGRVDLYLLDTDVPENPSHLRDVTDRLYGGDAEHRLRQEIVLGIGGVRVLQALGLAPTVFHANEGHAGFMGLERIRALVGSGCPLDQAVRVVRASTLFTTHTAVPAGFDRFDRSLVGEYLSGWGQECGIGIDWLMDLGQFPGAHPDEPFNMAVLCARLSERVNAVSLLHREITEQRVLGPLWPGRAAPVRCVTNGVHPRTWTPAPMAVLFDRDVGSGWDYADASQWDGVWDIPDAELWQARQQMRAQLVAFVRSYLPRVLSEQGWGADLGWAQRVLDPEALTIVVARRAAEYKETDLLVSMPQRLEALIRNAERPVQVIISGLAHPADSGGKERIRRIVEYSLREDIRTHMVYLPGYDMRLAQLLLAGADVWLNHPRRGDEACGTSFMKSVFSGGRVLTTADGGADELIVDGDNGWIIGDRSFGASREAIARNVFELLERVVVPEFYERDQTGVPPRWVGGIKRSLATLAWRVSSTGMVRAYERLYREAEHAVRTAGAGRPVPTHVTI
jgi:glycogen phosphorylase